MNIKNKFFYHKNHVIILKKNIVHNFFKRIPRFDLSRQNKFSRFLIQKGQTNLKFYIVFSGVVYEIFAVVSVFLADTI